MAYIYEEEKSKIFTEEGQVEFLKVRDRVEQLIQDSGAFMMTKAHKDITGEAWTMMAYVDRLVELGEIVELTDSSCFGQHRVFIGQDHG